MHHVKYKLFDEFFLLTTESTDMFNYLRDILEKHLVSTGFFAPNLIFNIPLISCDRRKYLTRTAPSDAEILKEISVKKQLSNSTPWNSTAPPLIPYDIPEISGRYFAYHAASVEIPSFGAIIILGNKGSGKSTNSLALCAKNNWLLLTDETCVVDKENLSIRALLRQPHGYTNSKNAGSIKSILRFQDNPWLNTGVSAPAKLAFELIYIPGLPMPHMQEVKNTLTSTQLFSRHQLIFGSSNIVSSNFSKKLAEFVPLYQIYHGGYQSFNDLQTLILETIEGF